MGDAMEKLLILQQDNFIPSALLQGKRECILVENKKVQTQ